MDIIFVLMSSVIYSMASLADDIPDSTALAIQCVVFGSVWAWVWYLLFRGKKQLPEAGYPIARQYRVKYSYSPVKNPRMEMVGVSGLRSTVQMSASVKADMQNTLVASFPQRKNIRIVGVQYIGEDVLYPELIGQEQDLTVREPVDLLGVA